MRAQLSIHSAEKGENRMVHFGVAGYPPAFSETPYRKDRLKILHWLNALGLNALELQMTYGPKTKIDTCRQYRELADEFGIRISVHASYFIVLTSCDPEKLRRSQETLKRTYELCDVLGADVVVLHPGPLYGEKAETVRDRFIDNLGQCVNGIGTTGIGLFIETAGKLGQLGSVDEILEDLKPVQPIRIKRGKTILAQSVDNPEIRVKAVCQKCNNRWMSDIEGENKPHMLAMMNDKPAVLRPAQQKLLTRWAVLKAMVLDGGYPKYRIPFYSESERHGMKPPSRFIPVGTLAWIGRLSVKGFHAGVTDTSGKINDIPEAFHTCITTIIVGHLVIQVLTMHVLPMFATTRIRPGCYPGAWDVNLLEVWPADGDKCWPPPFSFEMKGTTHNIGFLVNRYKMGEDVTK
jgi:hypothetical protein